MKIGVLCSNAEPDDEQGYTGDPTEVALLEAAARKGLQRKKLLSELEEVREVPFDSDTMMMATFHRQESEAGEGRAYYVAVKGAPHSVLQASDRILTESGSEPLSDAERKKWTGKADELAGRGLRLLMLADKEVADVEEEPYEKFVFCRPGGHGRSTAFRCKGGDRRVSELRESGW